MCAQIELTMVTPHVCETRGKEEGFFFAECHKGPNPRENWVVVIQQVIKNWSVHLLGCLYLLTLSILELTTAAI